jgi:flagellin
MSSSIITNYASTVASNNLDYANKMLTGALDELSSGSKLTSSDSNPGGMAVSMSLSTEATVSGDVNDNVNNANSYLQTQDGALQVVGNILSRMSELKTLYGDQTQTSTDQANYNTEFTSLQSELTSISTETFNGIALFGSGSLSVATTSNLSTTAAVTLDAANITSTASGGVGVITAATGSTSLGTVSLQNITDALNTVATMRAQNGAEQSQLGFAGTLLTTNQTNLESANSQISDVDVAAESTQLAKWNTLVQAGTSMLSQANQSASSLLKLLQ